MTLYLRLAPAPDFANLTPVQQHQFQYIEGYTGNLAESLSLMKFFTVHDEAGEHVYDMHLFCDEDGQVFVANTTQHVSSFSQGGASSPNPALEPELNAALTRFWELTNPKKNQIARTNVMVVMEMPPRKKLAAMMTPARKPASKKPASKKPASKKPTAKKPTRNTR